MGWKKEKQKPVSKNSIKGSLYVRLEFICQPFCLKYSSVWSVLEQIYSQKKACHPTCLGKFYLVEIHNDHSYCYKLSSPRALHLLYNHSYFTINKRFAWIFQSFAFDLEFSHKSLRNILNFGLELFHKGIICLSKYWVEFETVRSEIINNFGQISILYFLMDLTQSARYKIYIGKITKQHSFNWQERNYPKENLHLWGGQFSCSNHCQTFNVFACKISQ